MGKQARDTANPAELARLARLLQLALWVLIGMTACGKATDPLPDKNTNWLKVCTEDEACGDGLSCLCGACTRACEETSECERAASGASCHAVSDDGLQARCETHLEDGPSAVCMAGCSSDAECHASVGEDASCEAGLCVRTQQASATSTDVSEEADASDPQTSEPNEFEAFVADHRDCESVADCALIMPGCPLGCYAAVNTASAAEAEQVAETAREDSRCTYRCGSSPTLACENARCVAFTEGATSEDIGEGWTRLPSSPLSGRTEALVATVNDTIIVAGGWDFLCGPGANCVGPTTPPYRDGAAYDLETGRWKGISDAPVGFRGAVSAVVGDDVYALSQCEPGPTCPARALLRYRSKVDEWDMIPGPGPMGGHGMVAAADGLLVYGGSDEDGSGADFHFVADEERWIALPEDPLPPMFDRVMLEYEGRFLLFGTPIEGGSRDTKQVAAYDPQTNTWQTLAAARTQGYQVWRAGSLFYLNPHFSNADGGIYDASMDVWAPLPTPPYHDLAGLIADDKAAYEYVSGWVLDTRTRDWLEIDPRPDSSDVDGEAVTTAPNQGMVVFGGQTWTDGVGELVNDTWLWMPPAAPGTSQ